MPPVSFLKTGTTNTMITPTNLQPDATCPLLGGHQHGMSAPRRHVSHQDLNKSGELSQEQLFVWGLTVRETLQKTMVYPLKHIKTGIPFKQNRRLGIFWDCSLNRPFLIRLPKASRGIPVGIRLCALHLGHHSGFRSQDIALMPNTTLAISIHPPGP